MAFSAGAMALPAPTAGGEEVLIRGMGRILGWRVAAADGRIWFEGCTGSRLDPRDGRVVATAMRCPPRATVEATGIVLDFEPRSGRLRFLDEVGIERWAFVVPAGREAIEATTAGQRVVVEMPVQGHVSSVRREGPPP